MLTFAISLTVWNTFYYELLKLNYFVKSSVWIFCSRQCSIWNFLQWQSELSMILTSFFSISNRIWRLSYSTMKTKKQREITQSQEHIPQKCQKSLKYFFSVSGKSSPYSHAIFAPSNLCVSSPCAAVQSASVPTTAISEFPHAIAIASFICMSLSMK